MLSVLVDGKPYAINRLIYMSSGATLYRAAPLIIADKTPIFQMPLEGEFWMKSYSFQTFMISPIYMVCTPIPLSYIPATSAAIFSFTNGALFREKGTLHMVKTLKLCDQSPLNPKNTITNTIVP